MSLSRLFPTYQNSPKAKFGGNLLPSLLAQKLELFRIEARPGKAVVGVPANATIEMCIETSKGTGGLVVWFLPSRHREAAGSGLNSISLRIKCRHRVALGKHRLRHILHLHQSRYDSFPGSLLWVLCVPIGISWASYYYQYQNPSDLQKLPFTGRR